MQLSKLAAGLVLAGSVVAAPAQAIILADVVFIVDTSGSMGDDITQVKNRIVDFNNAMVNNGIDAQYGLVRFGGAASLIQDITDFATFNQAGSPFVTLTANGGGTEDGSAAIQVAMGATFRADTVRNFILITDEDDDGSANRAALDTDLAATAANELINIIGNPNDDSNGYYAALAAANGGHFFNILDFRNDPDPFFDNFIKTKVKEIIEEGGGGDNTVPEPASLALLGLGLVGMAGLRRKRA